MVSLEGYVFFFVFRNVYVVGFVLICNFFNVVD